MKRPITIISVISILLFIAALSWFGIGIYEDKKSGSEQNERVFDTLVFKTVSAANQYKIGTPDFSKKFIEAIGKIENYSALRLEANGNLIYSYPPAGFSHPSPSLTNSFRKTQAAGSGISLTISASMYSIQTNSVYHYARFAFILILLGTSISLILLVILRDKKENFPSEENTFSDPRHEDEIDIDYAGKEPAFFDNTAEETESTEDFQEKSEKEENPFDKLDFGGQEKNESADNKESDADTYSESCNDDANDEKEADEANETFQENQDSDIEEDQLPFATDISEDEIFSDFDDEKSGENIPEKQEDFFSTESEKVLENKKDFEAGQKGSLISEPEDNQDNDEKTLDEDSAETFNIPEETSGNNDFIANIDFDENEIISPSTGLKMQSSLSESLEEKIRLSLNENRELTLALLKVNNLDRGNEISNRLVEILKNDLPSAAEIFEYNSDGYAIILCDAGLGSCAETFDKIYENITSYLRENNSANEVVIGLSSVSGRNIDSQRLETEASQALNHALEDPDSPIIAFRANPEKYREYIENRKN